MLLILYFFVVFVIYLFVVLALGAVNVRHKRGLCMLIQNGKKLFSMLSS